ncbi:MAG: hypothetical protein LBU32_00235 [Clostridiales bacterium]|jgi:hypothetical protein|nr:hypothetical protein [Clostridiales bacterium]
MKSGDSHPPGKTLNGFLASYRKTAKEPGIFGKHLFETKKLRPYGQKRFGTVRENP